LEGTPALNTPSLPLSSGKVSLLGLTAPKDEIASSKSEPARGQPPLNIVSSQGLVRTDSGSSSLSVHIPSITHGEAIRISAPNLANPSASVTPRPIFLSLKVPAMISTKISREDFDRVQQQALGSISHSQVALQVSMNADVDLVDSPAAISASAHLNGASQIASRHEKNVQSSSNISNQSSMSETSFSSGSSSGISISMDDFVGHIREIIELSSVDAVSENASTNYKSLHGLNSMLLSMSLNKSTTVISPSNVDFELMSTLLSSLESFMNNYKDNDMELKSLLHASVSSTTSMFQSKLASLKCSCEAAYACLLLLTSPNMDVRFVSDNLISTLAGLLKNILVKLIIPTFDQHDPSWGSLTSSSVPLSNTNTNSTPSHPPSPSGSSNRSKRQRKQSHLVNDYEMEVDGSIESEKVGSNDDVPFENVKEDFNEKEMISVKQEVSRSKITRNLLVSSQSRLKPIMLSFTEILYQLSSLVKAISLGETSTSTLSDIALLASIQVNVFSADSTLSRTNKYVARESEVALQLSGMSLLCVIFEKCTSVQRSAILKDIFAAQIKTCGGKKYQGNFPILVNVPRPYLSHNKSGDVLTVSPIVALLCFLVHSSAALPTNDELEIISPAAPIKASSKKPSATKAGKKGGNSSAKKRNVKSEEQEEIPEETSPSTSDSVVKPTASLSRSFNDSCRLAADYISIIMAWAIRRFGGDATGVSDDECDVKLILSRFIDDFLGIVDLIEWSSAEIFLQCIIAALLKGFNLKGSNAPGMKLFNNHAITLLGVILARLQQIRAFALSNMIDVPSSARPISNDHGNSMSEDDPEKEVEISCSCGSSMLPEHTFFIKCAGCNVHSHGPCAGFPTPDLVPVTPWRCDQCILEQTMQRQELSQVNNRRAPDETSKFTLKLLVLNFVTELAYDDIPMQSCRRFLLAKWASDAFSEGNINACRFLAGIWAMPSRIIASDLRNLFLSPRNHQRAVLQVSSVDNYQLLENMPINRFSPCSLISSVVEHLSCTSSYELQPREGPLFDPGLGQVSFLPLLPCDDDRELPGASLPSDLPPSRFLSGISHPFLFSPLLFPFNLIATLDGSFALACRECDGEIVLLVRLGYGSVSRTRCEGCFGHHIVEPLRDDAPRC
jgi:hypothetical protein